MSASDKPTIALESIEERIAALSLPDVDAVIGIERGGRVPAEITAAVLNRPLGRIGISFRDDLNNPAYPEPQLVERAHIPSAAGTHLLLVDDVSVTGGTLRKAAAELEGFTVTTLVLKGAGDYVAYPEIDRCVTWPWSAGTGRRRAT